MAEALIGVFILLLLGSGICLLIVFLDQRKRKNEREDLKIRQAENDYLDQAIRDANPTKQLKGEK
jgi:hypothetical protein